MFERINKFYHYGLNSIVWCWVNAHAAESGQSFIDYMFSKTRNNYVIVDCCGKSIIYENGFATYTIFNSRAEAETYARRNHISNCKVINELYFLKERGLNTDILFNAYLIRKFFNKLLHNSKI